MKIIDCEQGSDAWFQARAGRVTASNLSKIVTKSGELSTQASGYMARLVSEWFIGRSLHSEDEFVSAAMERGVQMEAEAAAEYAFDTGLKIEQVGLCVRDDELAAGSPDRLAGDDGLLEVKCPLLITHMGYRLGGMGSDYRTQVQGELWVTGRKWADLISYSPILPRVTLRTERDDKFIEAIEKAVRKFVARMDEEKDKLKDHKAQYDAEQSAKREAQEAAHPF